MKKFLLLLTFISLSLPVISTELSSGFHSPWVAVDFLPEYTYNRSWGSNARFNFKTSLPLIDYCELTSGLQLSTANIYAVDVTVRPKIPIKIGEFFFDVEPYYRAVARNRIHDVVLAASFGYRFDYLSFQIGWFGRWLVPFDGGGSVAELTNVLYKAVVYCRPQKSPWNIYLTIGNMDDFLFERHQQPVFQLEGRYDLGGYLRFTAGVECLTSGMFHFTAAFYGINARLGVALMLNR